MWEVPFIWTYRRDYLHPVMTKEHLWTVFRLEEDWDKTVASKMRLSDEVSALEDAAQLADRRLEAETRSLEAEGRHLQTTRVSLQLARWRTQQGCNVQGLKGDPHCLLRALSAVSLQRR